MIINNKHIKIRRFNSGEMRLLFEDFLPLIKNNFAEILYEGEESIFELFLIIKLLQSKKIEINLTLAYLPYQRMEHNNGYEACTVSYVAQIFNSLKLNHLTICEPHCKLNHFENVSSFSLVDEIYKCAIKEIDFNEEKDILVFTDKGSHERYGHLGKNHIYFEKERELISGQIAKYKMIGKLEPNRKIIIIDDIISSGETIINCVKLLNEKQVHIVAGHFEKNKLNNRVLELPNVACVYSSNSLTKKSNNNKLRLFKVQNLIKGENK